MKRGTAKLRAIVRRRRFLKWYLAGPPDVALNGAGAVLAAGLTRNERSATVIATRFLADPLVRAEIEKHADDVADETTRLRRELLAVAYSRATDLGHWDNAGRVLTPSRLLTDAQTASVQAVEFEETTGEQGVTRKVRTQQYNKLKAIELLLLLDRRLIQRHEVTGLGGQPIRHLHEHVVFYLPAPARLRAPVIIDASPTDGAPQNGDRPALPPATGNGGPP